MQLLLFASITIASAVKAATPSTSPHISTMPFSTRSWCVAHCITALEPIAVGLPLFARNKDLYEPFYKDAFLLPEPKSITLLTELQSVVRTVFNQTWAISENIQLQWISPKGFISAHFGPNTVLEFTPRSLSTGVFVFDTRF